MLEEAVLDQLFRAARSSHAFTSQPVTDETLRQLYELLKWGPTAWNAQPGRYVFVRSPESKARLAPALSSGKKSEMHKERLRIVDKELVEQWKATASEVDREYKTEMAKLSTESWVETRRLSPRMAPLGTDVLGNRYWVFSSRKTKERDFGGWVIVETPVGTEWPTGDAKPETSIPDQDTEIEEDNHVDLENWFYINTAEDIRQLISWTTYLAAKATLAAEAQERRERRVSKGTPSKGTPSQGTPNKLGQVFTVEVPPPKSKGRPAKGRKIDSSSDTANTRLLCDELTHALEWIEERYVLRNYY